MDPFCGSGTTGIAASKYNRRFIGIDNVEEYLELTKKDIKQWRNKKMRDFNKWLKTFKSTLADWTYYTDFEKYIKMLTILKLS